MNKTTITQTRQPAGFYILFLTEMWERFGFYLISSLLILYMTKAMGYGDKVAYTAFAAFSALLYVTPAVGGYIADHFMGYRRTLMFGAALLSVGYTMMAIPFHHMIYPGLACVVMGTGFFKAMPYALLNQLYKSKEQRKKMDGAFTLYYLSIQIGGLAPLFFGGFAAHYFGWHATFAMAAGGMCIGFTTFFFGKKHFENTDNCDAPQKVRCRFYACLVSGCLLVAATVTFLLEHTTVTNVAVWSIAATMLTYVAWRAKKLDNKERMRLAVAVLMTGMGVLFFALYYQQAMSLTLFIDRNVNRHFLGMTLPSSSYWTFNPIWILILGPCLNALYNKFGQKDKDPSIPMKFGVGLVFMGVGYLTIVVGTGFGHDTHRISSWWIVASYAFQSTAELLVNALGTAMIAKFAHKSVLSVMMGIWFVGTAIGGLVAGSFAKMTAVPKHATALQSMHIYSHAFSVFAWASVSIGIVTCILAPALMRMVNEKQATKTIAGIVPVEA